MYYILGAILIIIVYIVFVKILSSLLKGCLVGTGIIILVMAGFLFMKSSKEPVVLFNRYRIEDFKISRIEFSGPGCIKINGQIVCPMK